MLTIIYEDDHLLVVRKPPGMESQTARGFEPDMVSEIKKHIHSLCTEKKEPYVGVIHRLDKPVDGLLVYAKTSKAAASLSNQLQNGDMKKTYRAVVCGKLVDTVGNYVDYLLKDGKTNVSRIVDKGISGAKRAELSYSVLGEVENPGESRAYLSLLRITILTGRHHQIRVQMAGHGTPVWGDNKYNPAFQSPVIGRRMNVALSACELSFLHPVTGTLMEFSQYPREGIFNLFPG